MIIKLLLVIGLVLLYFFMSKKPNGKKKYYYLTVLMFMVRELNVPFLGVITPGAVMAYVLFLGTLSNYNGFLRKWTGYAICVAFSVLIGLLQSEDINSDRVLSWASNVFIVMILAIIPQGLFTTEKDIVKLARCVLVAGFVYSFTTIMGYYGLADGTVIYAGDVLDSENYHASRSYGISENNLVQTISVISIPLIPWAKLNKKWMNTALLLVFMFAAVITIKRMSFVAMIPSLFYYSYYLRNNGASIRFLAIGALLFIMLSAFWEPIMYRFGIAGLGGKELDDNSTETRFVRNAMAYKAFLESPIFGNGAGYYVYIHNGFYELLCNMGLMGFFLVFLKFIPSFKSVFRLNPWAYCQVVFLVTAFSLESAINHSQMMSFMGFYLAGYYLSKRYNWYLR